MFHLTGEAHGFQLVAEAVRLQFPLVDSLIMTVKKSIFKSS